MNLSDRIRPNCEAAPWVVAEVRRLESELSEAYAELRKQRPSIKAVFDRSVWERANARVETRGGLGGNAAVTQR
jgi:hypothetical protein